MVVVALRYMFILVSGLFILVCGCCIFVCGGGWVVRGCFCWMSFVLCCGFGYLVVWWLDFGLMGFGLFVARSCFFVDECITRFGFVWLCVCFCVLDVCYL